MEALAGWTTVLDEFYLFSTSCLSRPTTAPECADFWPAWIFGCFALGSVALLLLAWKSTSYSIQFYSARLVPLESEHAHAEEPATYLGWVSEEVHSGDPAFEEIEDCIRAAFARIPVAEPAPVSLPVPMPMPMPEEFLGKAA